jgi:hypothetical protein
VVDIDGCVVSVGSALAELLPELAAGVALERHFEVVVPMGVGGLHGLPAGVGCKLRHVWLDLDFEGEAQPRDGGGRCLDARVRLNDATLVGELGLDASAAVLRWVDLPPAPDACLEGGGQRLSQRAPGAVELPSGLLEAFVVDLRSGAAEAGASGSGAELREVAHRLAGATGVYGFLALSAEIRAIAQAFREGAAALPDARARLAAVCRSVADALDATRPGS